VYWIIVIWRCLISTHPFNFVVTHSLCCWFGKSQEPLPLLDSLLENSITKESFWEIKSCKSEQNWTKIFVEVGGKS
jgi:hypothetical protein